MQPIPKILAPHNGRYSIHIVGRLITMPLIWSLFMFGALGIGFGCDMNSPEVSTDLYPDLSIPVYSNAINIKNYTDQKAQIKSKSYGVTLPYPADEIVRFYNKVMTEYDFVPYISDGYEKKEWSTFQDESRGDNRYIRQFAKAWLCKDNKKKAILFLRYETSKENNWSDELIVTLQIMPAFNERALTNLFNELEEEGKLEEFMELLKKYSTPDQTVDFDRAIRENPQDSYLPIYKDIIEGR